MPMEDIVEQMRKDIGVEIPRVARNVQPGSFLVRYDSPSPQTAMKVAERLASFFIDENVQQREGQANLTAEFLATQLADAKKRLIEHEKKLEAYRGKYGPEMPSQMQSNIQVMQTTQVQLQALVDAATRDQERKVTVSRLLADAGTTGGGVAVDAAQGGGTAAQQLETARAQLAALALRLKPEHPDMIRAQKAVRDLERKAEAEALDAPLAGTPQPARMTPVQLAEQKRVNDLKSELEMLDRRLAANQVQQSRLQTVLASMRGRLEAAPARETELTELMRDYGTLQETYTSLLVKSQASDIAANLERRQIGEQFRLLDPPRLPQRPISPNRPRMTLMGLLAGLAFGLGMAALLEYRDTTFATDSDLVSTLSVPVLAVVPAMFTARERQRARRVRRLAWSVAGMVLVAGGGLAAWKLWLVDTLGR
jgi:polysaccharide chain length determinant protein (PEP-CTERM system associated)